MTEVVVDGILYVPKIEVVPLTDDKLRRSLLELVSLYYFGNWSKASCRVWDAMYILAPEIADLVAEDPNKAYQYLLEQVEVEK